jgi:BirA family biotin operon repressor/biotin-[acetyl-CoA-carboxylase] ligase
MGEGEGEGEHKAVIHSKKQTTSDFPAKVIKYKSLDSTQTTAKRIAGDAQDGTVVLAGTQSGGRGRMERSWSSAPGGLYFSIILKRQFDTKNIPLVTYAMALSVKDALLDIAGIKAGLKWPNDVMARIPGKNQLYAKIAGILTESSFSGQNIDTVIIGVGININNRIPFCLAKSAVSAKQLSGERIQVKNILDEILRAFNRRIEASPSTIIRKYAKSSLLLSKTVSIDDVTGHYKGKVTGFLPDGALKLKLSSGPTRIFRTGDLSAPALFIKP